jgi:hypothetical protein
MAIDFNGTSEYYHETVGAVSGLPFTLACWFNKDNATSNQVLVSVSDDTKSWHLAWLGAGGAETGDPVVLVTAENIGAIRVDPTTSGFSASQWTHACGVWTSSTSRKVFINGGSAGTGTTSSNPAGFNTTGYGAAENGPAPASFIQPFGGLLAEVGIWSAALTDAEVASLADGFSPAKIRPQSLVRYRPFVREPLCVKSGVAVTTAGSPAAASHTRIYK